MIAHLELRVILEADERTLRFELSDTLDELDYRLTPMGTVRLAATPRQHLEALFEALNQFARRAGGSPDTGEVAGQLARAGQRLYRELFPSALKEAYRRIRAIRRDEPLTLLITSDEPWIPWELVKPFEGTADAGVAIDDPFLCESFYLTRWLAGFGERATHEVDTVAPVIPGSNLRYAKEEAAYLAGLPARAPQVRVLDPLRHVGDVQQAIATGNVRLWHFGSHGSFSAGTPDRSAVHLADGELRAEAIEGEIALGVHRARPFVMLNACHTARQDFALTDVGGWARQWIRAGASAFVGTQWEALDALAAPFATTLYERLWAGDALGKAAHAARIHIRDLQPTNPTWLAYAVYGHPHLLVWLRGQVGPAIADREAVERRPLEPRVVPEPTAPQGSVRSGPRPGTPEPDDAVLADGFRYDAFVSYQRDCPEAGWVENELAPALEDAGLVLCLPDRDFDPGVPPTEETARAVTQSRRTIAILTTAYLADHFARLQAIMVNHLGATEGQYRLIPLRRERGLRLPLAIDMLVPVDFTNDARRDEMIERLIKAIRKLPRR